MKERTLVVSGKLCRLGKNTILGSCSALGFFGRGWMSNWFDWSCCYGHTWISRATIQLEIKRLVDTRKNPMVHLSVFTVSQWRNANATCFEPMSHSRCCNWNWAKYRFSSLL